MNGNTVPRVFKRRLSEKLGKAVVYVILFLMLCHTDNCVGIRADDLDSSNGSATTNSGVLTLSNGNTVRGHLRSSDSSEVIRWQAWDFDEPFEFRSDAVKSVKFPAVRSENAGLSNENAPKARREFAIDLANGDIVLGELLDWSDGLVTVRSGHVGDIQIPTSAIHRMHRIEENASLVFASLAGLQDWTTTSWDTSGWSEDGDHLWTQRPGATLNGDLGVPSRAVVEFELSWKGKPDFVFAIGVDAQKEKDSSTDGWRFETVVRSLAIVREQSEDADLDFVVDLTNESSVHLIAYLDQKSGRMEVFRPDGTAIGGIKIPEQNAKTTDVYSGVRLINRGSNLTLKRLRIASWIGEIPTQIKKGQASIAMSGGRFNSGTIQEMDPKTKEILVGDDDQTTAVDLDDVIAIEMGSKPSNAKLAQCAVFLRNGMRISGALMLVDEDSWVIQAQQFDEEVRVPRTQVRTVIVFRNETDLESGSREVRIGHLELGPDRLTGHLLDTESEENANQDEPHGGTFCFSWKPFGSRNGSRLKTSATGRIVYRYPPRPNNSTTAARALAMQRLRLQQRKRGLNFGELFLKRTDRVKSKTETRDAHVVHVRTGDVIACRVDRIDEDGVWLSTVESDDGFVPHQQVKAIEFSANATSPDLNAAKRDRLLTIPRLQKSAPPTHLLCSQNGDFLRCRFSRMDSEKMVVEVQLAEVEVPRERVSHLIWFHPKAADEKAQLTLEAKEELTQLSGMAQVLLREGKRVTFRPQSVSAKDVSGESTYLGPCRFDVGEIDQLIFGARIGTEVADLAYNQWKLRPAVEPLVAQDTGAQTGNESTLVGKEAPEFKLQQVEGGEFRLSEHRGKIVVLDFWASWCAPCMLTMPLVEKAIAEYKSDQVELYSINLEESAAQIRSAFVRHELNSSVLMDVDGVAAARYEARAIPQLVIVGADGKIERLFVGGGASVVEQMRAAINELLETKPSS